MSKRNRLLMIGMGLSLFAIGGTAVNVIIFPFARAYYGCSAWSVLGAFALALCALFYAGGRMEDMGLEALERTAKASRPLFLAALLCLHLLLGYLMEYTPMGDNHKIYDGARTLAQLGNFGGGDFDLYLARYKNQWGFFLMITVFCKGLLLLGIHNQFYAMVIVQALLYTGAMAVLLGDARRLRGVRAELMLTLLLAVCLPLYLAAAVLYTDTYSLPFVVYALHYALELAQQKTLPRTLLCAAKCALMVLIGCQIKMTVAIVLIAAVIVWLLTVRPVRAVGASLLAAAIVFGGMQGVQHYMRTQVLDEAMVEQHSTPTVHWIMMSIPTASNPYGGATGDYGITWGMMEAGAPREEIMDSIYTRMKDRIYTLRYPNRLVTALMRKNAAAQGDGTFGMTEMLDDGPVRENAVSAVVLEGRPLYPAYSAVCSGVWYAVLVYAALGVYLDMRRRDMSGSIAAVAVLGMLIFLLLWESRSRYMFSFVPLMLLLACTSVSRPKQALDVIGEGKLCTAVRNLWIKRFAR